MELIVESLLLGLTTGAYCLLSCSPMITPLFLFKGDSYKKSGTMVAHFLLGRLSGYVIIGILSGLAGSFIMELLSAKAKTIFSVLVSLITGGILIFSGLKRTRTDKKECKRVSGFIKGSHSSFVVGILTGVSLCPPFITAITRVLDRGGVAYGLLFFLLFYLSTSIYFLPLIGSTFLSKRIPALREISKYALIIMGAYILIFRGILGVFS